MSKRLGGIIGCKDKRPLHGIKTGSPIVATLGQQYNVGEKPIVILYTYINCHAGTPKKTLINKNMEDILQPKPTNQKQCSTY